MIIDKIMTGEPCPLNSILALLNALPVRHCSPHIVKMDYFPLFSP